MEILRKTNYHDIIYWIFHFEFENFNAKYPRIDGLDEPKAVMNMTMVPILFGFKLTGLNMLVVITPPTIMTTLLVARFNFIPIAPMKNILINHVYQTGTFISRLMGKIAFYFFHDIVIISE